MQVNDTAPLFEGIDQNEQPIRLADFRGKKVILYFYPKDSTPGCTAEACSLRDGYSELLRLGFVVIGVSGDSPKSHQKFIANHKLPFSLVADTDHAIALAYGTWGEKKFMGRTYTGMIRKTFVINEEGRIERIFEKVNTLRHFDQIVESYR